MFVLVPPGVCASRLGVGGKNGSCQCFPFGEVSKDSCLSYTCSEISKQISFPYTMQVFFQTNASILYVSGIVCYIISLRVGTQFLILLMFSQS